MRQAVLSSFFVRLALGDYHAATSVDLTRMLKRIARNKVNDALRRHTADVRDVRRTVPLNGQAQTLVDKNSDPPAEASFRELLLVVRESLDPDERRLAEMRADGATWEQVGEAFDRTPRAMRKRLRKTIERVTLEFALEE